MKKVVFGLSIMMLTVNITSQLNHIVWGATEQISDDIRSGHFTIDQEVYQLPMAYQDFTTRGWTMADTADGNIQLQPGDISAGVELKKGNARITVFFGNAGDNQENITVVPIVQVTVDREFISGSTVKMMLPGSVPLFEVSADSLISLYGLPDINSYRRNHQIVYRSAKDAEFCFTHTDEGKIEFFTARNEIAINQKKEQLKLEWARTIDQVIPTTEVANYQIPQELGTNIASGMIEVEGNLYQFPIPVSAFLRNGWILDPNDPPVVQPKSSGFSGGVKLSRGLKQYSGSVYNLGTADTTLPNCFFDTLYSDYIAIKLPGAIEVGTSKEKLIQVLTGVPYQHLAEYGGEGEAYEFAIENTTLIILVTVSTTTRQVTAIDITNAERLGN